MYNTEGVDAIATITTLRTDVDELLVALQDGTRFIGIQRNNQPVAVLLSWERYREIKPFLEDLAPSKS